MSDSAIKSKPAQATKAADWQPDEVGAQGGATLRSFFPDKPLWTPEIDRKAAMVAEWMACDLAGAHIWGVQRTGKSEFAKYLLDVIPTMLEGSAVAIMWNFLGLKPKNADQLLKRCLVDMGCNTISARETLVLQARLVALVGQRCQAVSARRVLIIVDEMQNIPHELYPVLMSVTADLMKLRLVPHLLSIGQPEMQTTIDLVFQGNYLQMIGRFFQRTEVYCGLTSQDIRELLSNMEGTDREFTRQHFPGRAAEGWSIVDLAVLAGKNIAGARVRLPLGYLRPALNFMFRQLADDLEAIVDRAVALSCFKFTGLHKVIGHYVEYPNER
jgi:hypothetical protein